MTKRSDIVFALIFAAVPAVSQQGAFPHKDTSDSEAHCRYLMNEASAQRDYLRTPTAYSGLSQPDTGLPLEVVFGVTESVSNVKKASLTMELARANCDQYGETLEAHKKIFFALPAISKSVLEHRLILVDKTVEKLDLLIDENMEKVAAQTLTRPAVYSLQTAKLNLLAERALTLTGIITPYVPPQSSVPIRVMIGQKRAADSAFQKATARLQKQSNWDVALTFGGYQQIGTNNIKRTNATGAYGTASVSYNLGSKGINSRLDQSVKAYEEWQDSEFDDVSNQAVILKNEIAATIEIQESQWRSLSAQQEEIRRDLKLIEGQDTEAAVAFRLQLTADMLVLQVNIDDAAFRLGELRSFLRDNY